jgi:multimeric flavodoxin WrbA
MTSITQLAHHGIIFVPSGYIPSMFTLDEAKVPASTCPMTVHRILTADTQATDHSGCSSCSLKPLYLPCPLRSQGGSPWGPGTLAGPDGSRQPSAVELEQAEHQGKTLANVVKKLTA